MSDKEAQLTYKLTKPDVKVIDAERRRTLGFVSPCIIIYSNKLNQPDASIS
jgi:hypothetical protein